MHSRNHRNSSLPTSLIPHLFDGPQQPRFSQTRSTLHHSLDLPAIDSPDRPTHTPLQRVFDHPPHRYASPAFHSPMSSSDRLPPHSWREGEPGPSSLLRPIQPSFSTRPHLDSDPTPLFEHPQHRGERVSSGRSWPGDYHPSFDRLPGPSQLLDRSPGNHSPSYQRQDSYSFPAVGSLSISAPTPSYVRAPSSDTGSLHRSDAPSIDVGSNDGEGDPDGSQRGKRRRAESVETDDNAKKSRNSRKTAVACNFCRGRKLRCNGEKPSCYNCTVRKFECEYVPVQRRRGPGKAPKGTRKRGGGRIDSKAAGDRPSVAVAEHELDSLAPEVRPYMSVLSLNSFGFQPPPPSPQYPPGPRWSPSNRGGRTSGSRETSSEDRSDGEKEFRAR